MSNIKIKIDGVEKEFEPIKYSGSKGDDFCYKRQWYREVEPVKQDYEILSFKTDISTWYKNTDGIYESDILTPPPTMKLPAMLKHLKDGIVTIHSVKRLKDGEVFTVGVDNKRCGKIEGFTLTNEELKINL